MYLDDTPSKLYDEFVALEQEIERVGRNIKTLAQKEANAIADYENAKNTTLLQLYVDEAKPDFVGKRTEAQRTAIYREKHHDLRLSKGLAIADAKSERDLLSALQSKLSGMQSRRSILMMERDRSYSGGQQ